MGLFSSFIESVTGGIADVVGAVAGGVTQVLGAAAPIIQTVAPLAAPLLGQFIGGRQQLDFLRLQQATPGGGAGAVAASNALTPRTNIGFLGNQLTGANPITRAQIFPPFDTSRLPSRPQFGLIELLQALLPQFQFPQTTSFRQQGFGASVSPGFRPFTPSFRSGQLGTQGQFFPGVSQGFAPQVPGVATPFVGGQAGPLSPASQAIFNEITQRTPAQFGFGRAFSPSGGFGF